MGIPRVTRRAPGMAIPPLLNFPSRGRSVAGVSQLLTPRVRALLSGCLLPLTRGRGLTPVRHVAGCLRRSSAQQGESLVAVYFFGP